MSAQDGFIGFSIGLVTTQLEKDVQRVNAQLKRIGDSAIAEGQRSDRALSSIGKALGGILSIAAAKAFVQQMVSVRGEIESLGISFETLLGSKRKADALFGSLRQFAVSTPMMLGDLAKGAQTLLGFNVEAEKVMPTLKSIGDISMGDAQKFQSLTLAFSQMSSTGKLMGQDLLQMINSGFNPLVQIAQETGESLGTLKEKMAEGAISAEMVEHAFMSATAEGGKFHGMLEKQSKGLRGSLSNLQGAIEDAFNEIGTASQGILSDAVNVTTILVKNYRKIGDVIAFLVLQYGAYRAALIANVAAQRIEVLARLARIKGMKIEQLALTILKKKHEALKASMLANPYVLVAAAVATLCYGIYKLATADTAAERAQKRYNDEMERTAEYFDSLRSKGDRLTATLNDQTASVYDQVKAWQELKDAFPALGVLGYDMERFQNLSPEEQKALLSDQQKKLTRAEIENKINFYTREVERTKALMKKYNQDESRRKDYAEALEMQAKYKRALADELNLEAEATRERIRRKAENVSALDARTKAQQTYNEALKKRREIEANPARFSTDELTKAIADVDAAEKKLKELGIDTSAKPKAAGKDTQAEARKRQNELRKQQEAYVRERAKEAREAEYEATRATIDAKKEGLEKELAQNAFNQRRLLDQNEERKQEMLEALRDLKETEWKASHPREDEKGYTFDRSSVTASNLSAQQQNALVEYERIAQSERDRADREAYEKTLRTLENYQEARLRIRREYAQKEADLYETNPASGEKTLRQGITEAHVAELQRQAQEAEEQSDETFARRSEDFVAWCNAIAGATLERLTAQLDILEASAKATKATGKELTAEEAAQIRLLEKEIASLKAKLAQTSPEERSLKEWQDLNRTLTEAVGSFQSLGNAIAEFGDERIADLVSATGAIASSTIGIISGIVQLTQASTTSVAGTSVAAGKAIKAIERASIILTIITAAITVVQKLIDMLDLTGDKARQKRIEGLQQKTSALAWQVAHMGFDELDASAGNALANLGESLDASRGKAIAAALALGDTATAIELIKDSSKGIEAGAEALADAYIRADYTAGKALGTARYKRIREEISLLAKQIALLEEANREEAAKKKTDQKKIEENAQKQKDLAAEMARKINEALEGILGGSATDLAKQLGDAFIDAFQRGEDAAKAWGDTVDDIIAGVVRNLLVQQLLEGPMGALFDKLKKRYFQDGDIDVTAPGFNDFLNDYFNGLNAIGADFERILDELEKSNPLLADKLRKSAEREGARKGIAQASQDSVDELNGRATAIQSHTYAIMEETRRLGRTGADILRSVVSIEAEVRRTNGKLDNVTQSIAAIDSRLHEAQLKGIKVK